MEESKYVLKRIIKFVALGHIILILTFSFSFKKRSKKQILTTRVLKENFRTIEKPRPKAKKAVAKVAVKKSAPTKKVAPAKVTPKKTEPPKKEVKIAQTSKLPKIEPPKETLKLQQLELVLPQMVTKLDIEQKDSFEELQDDKATENPYQSYVGAIIGEELKLKLGAFVSFEVTLNSQGEVLSVKHLESSDAFSKDFIIENIKHMQFAKFFGEIAKESEYTLVFTTKGSS